MSDNTLEEILSEFSDEAEKNPHPLDAWREKYADITVDGLSDGRNYVRLATSEADGVETLLVFRPYFAAGPGAIDIRGKLSIFPKGETQDWDDEDSFNKAIATLKKSFSGLFGPETAPKEHPRRVGTEIGYRVYTGGNGADAVREFMAKEDLVNQMLSKIEARVEMKFKDRDRLVQAISESYETQLAAAYPIPKEALN